jgi:exopolysaccharide biosynthesis polyprenyl glycosylphosphotransferase
MSDPIDFRVWRTGNPFTALAGFILAWLLVIALPMAVLQLTGLSVALEDLAVRRSALAATVALVIGFWLMGRVLNLPGTRGAVHGVPIMLGAFLLAALVLLIFRVEYSRYMLVYSTVAATVIAAQRKTFSPVGSSQRFLVVPFGNVHELEVVPGLETSRMTEPVIPEGKFTNIVADFRTDMPEEWERMLAGASLAGIPVYHYKQLTESLTGQVKIEHLSENSFGSLVPNQSYTPIKRSIDILGSLLALLVIWPVMLVIAVLIKLEDGGPVFYIQNRAGLGGVPFRMYKFRSMRAEGPVHSGEDRDASITHEDDPRITGVGRVIRRLRLDELPQLVNVLQGRMSLIGPRPEANALAQWYDESLAFYSYRNIVKPGLTGWAQVNQGHVADLAAVDTKLQYDFYYIKYFSFGLDVLIAMRTVHTVLTGFGSK